MVLWVFFLYHWMNHWMVFWFTRILFTISTQNNEHHRVLIQSSLRVLILKLNLSVSVSLIQDVSLFYVHSAVKLLLVVQ